MKKFLFVLAVIACVCFAACEGSNTDKPVEKTYTISFNPNGGTGGPTSVKASFNILVPVLTASAPVKDGFYFSGYYDTEAGPDDEGEMYYAGDLTPVKILDIKSDIELFAYWTTIPTVTIIFNSNGGNGTIAPQSVYEKTSVILTANSFTKTGYTFAGWALSETGNVEYADGAAVTVDTSNLLLFAVWTANTYTISFDANEGTGGQTASITATYDAPMPPLTAAAPTRGGGFEFDGYFDAQSGGVMYYKVDLSSARNWDKTENTTLFASWSAPAAITADNSSIVSLVQSTTVTDPAQYTYATIKAQVDEAIALAGGLTGIVKTGDTVVLKPNIITTIYGWSWTSMNNTNPTGTKISAGAVDAATAAAPNGITTDWRIVQAVAENVRAIIGPTGKILVMEGSGKGTETHGTNTQYANVGYTTVNLTAVDEIIAIDLIGGTGANGTTYWSSVPAATPSDLLKIKLDNHVFTSRWPATGTAYYNGDGEYYVVKRMYEADAFINIPILKLHTTAGTTGNIKNISIGAAPPRVYGNSATDIGRNNRIPHSEANGLHKWVADYYAAMPADFVIMDALQGCDEGPLPPVSGTTNLKKMCSILASKDGLAIDTVLANVIKVDYTKVGHLVYLTARGEVGTKPGKRLPVRGNPEDITVVGNKKVHDLRDGVTFSGNVTTGLNGNIGNTRLDATQLAKPTVDIHSAQFIGQNLALNLDVSADTVKVDIYIDNVYIRSVNSGLNKILIDASKIAAGSRAIKVEAYTNYMAYETATITAVK